MDSVVATWSEDDRRFDAAFSLDDDLRERIAATPDTRESTSEEVVRTTDRVAASEARRVQEIEKEFAGHSNLQQIRSGLEFQAQMFKRKRDVFLRYFSVPGARVRWFEDSELGVAGWAVEHRGEIVRAFLLPIEASKK